MPALLLLAARAGFCLLLARIALARFRTGHLGQRNRAAGSQGRVLDHRCAGDVEQAEGIAWIVPRVAGRMPFRSDCLVQAMAAQDLLLSKGLASDVVIGVEGGEAKDFASHAWLVCNDLVVVGGDIGQFEPILGTD